MADSDRRRFFRLGASLAVGAAVPLLWSQRSEAGKVSKTALGYRDHPYEGHSCSACIYFRPGPNASAPGNCAVVAGSISPHGYCLAFTPKA